jgi:transposase
MEEVDEQELHVERVAAVDLGKAVLEACVRVPQESKPGGRLQEVGGYATTGALLELADWLRCWGVTRVVMESTSDYWKGVYWLLQAEGFECWLVNAGDVKNVPGRPKTDRADVIWLARSPSGACAGRRWCTPADPAAADLTRYRRWLIQDRTRQMQRVEKLLEDAQIKLSWVAGDIFGVSGRAMLEALFAGQRDPKVLVQMAKARMRAKLAELEEALRGCFTDHHAAILRMLLDTSTGTASRSPRSTPRSRRRSPLSPARWPSSMRSPGSAPPPPGADRRGRRRGGPVCLPCPPGVVGQVLSQVHESAGKTKPKGRGRATLAGRDVGQHRRHRRPHRQLPGARYRRIAKRRGKQQAIVATGNSVLVIVYHLLRDPKPGSVIWRRSLRRWYQQAPQGSQPRRPTPSRHRPADHDPKRQGRHHRTPSRLTHTARPCNPSDDHRIGLYCRPPPTVGSSGQQHAAHHDTHRPDAHGDRGNQRHPGRCDIAMPPADPRNIAGKTGPPGNCSSTRRRRAPGRRRAATAHRTSSRRCGK